jgi:hypothetical protein
MDFGRAFSFVFEDQEWFKKVGVAALILLIPIAGPIFLAGWVFETIKRVIRRDPDLLPDWSDFGGYFGDGFKVVVVAFVYMLPVILIQACSQGVFLAGQENFNDDTVVTALAVLNACFGCLTFLYSLLMGLVIPAALGNFAANGDLKAAFQFGDVFGLVRAAPGAYALVLLGNLVAGLVGSLGVIACGIGVLLTSAYAGVVTGHLTGQAYNQAAPSV